MTSATGDVLDEKPLLLGSFWDGSEECGTYGSEVIKVFK